ncbi:MAG: abortive phage resistance protein-like protein [Verrucomicrobiales bacterium]|nr:abortive phage resistance protein-like protein [Verrucomicrobiales bacterium]
MALTSRKKRPLGRQELQERDDRIFLVASEDCYAVKQYFDGLKFRRVKVVTLPTEDNNSSPQHVVDRLKAAVARYDFGEGNQLWFALDTDHWVRPNHIPAWVGAFKQAKQIDARPAISNPCFEVWLLLHVAKDLSELPDAPNAESVVTLLRRLLPNGYSKINVPMEHFPRERAELAIGRAGKMDPNPKGDWPKSAGTHFYRLMKAIFESER